MIPQKQAIYQSLYCNPNMDMHLEISAIYHILL